MTEVRITNAYIIRALRAEQDRRKEKRTTRTAEQLITERLTELGRPPVTEPAESEQDTKAPAAA